MSDFLDGVLRQGLRSIATAAADALPGAPAFRSSFVDDLSPKLGALFAQLNPHGDEGLDKFLAQALRLAVASNSRPIGSDDRDPRGEDATVIDRDGAAAFRDVLEVMFDKPANPAESALGALQAMLPTGEMLASSVPTVAAAVYLPKGVIDRIAKSIEKRLIDLKKRVPLLRKLLRKLPTKTFDKFTDLLEKELPIYVKRAVVAAVVQVAGIAIKPAEAGMQMAGGKSWRDLRSDPDIGAQVHTELQDSYLEQWLNTAQLARSRAAGVNDFVLEEGRVYRHMADNGKELKRDLAISRDASIFAFWAARSPFQAMPVIKKMSDKNLGIYREDCVHQMAQSVWEIKPIRSAAYAVFQEFHYRWAFNLANALVQDLLLALPGMSAIAGKKVPRVLRRLGGVSLPDGLVSGSVIWWKPCKASVSNLTSSYKKRPPKNGSYFAIVVTVPQMPGVVLYVTFDLPIEYLLVLVPLVNNAISRLAKATQDLIDKVEEAAAVAVRALIATLAFVGAVVLFAAVFAAFVGSAPAWVPALGAVAAVMVIAMVASKLAPDASDADMQQRIQAWQAVLANDIRPGDVRLLPMETGLVIDIGGGEPEAADTIPQRIDLTLGQQIHIRGLPLGLVPVIGEILNGGVLFGAGALLHAFPSPEGDATV
jgi:hypothetical protein